MKEAVGLAREFLTEYVGLSDHLLYLEELQLVGKTWILEFRYSRLFLEDEWYQVEIDDERGDVIGFRRIEIEEEEE
jgi:hypothetical protein